MATQPILFIELLIPVTASAAVDYGAERLQTQLADKGWGAQVYPLVGQGKLLVWVWKKGPGEQSFTAKTSKGPVQKRGVPFNPGEAHGAVQSAASSIGTKLAALSAWAQKVAEVASDLTPSAIAKTSADYIEKKGDEARQALEQCRAKGGWFCGLQALGVPSWVPPVAIGIGVLLVLGQLASIKRTFLGGR